MKKVKIGISLLSCYFHDFFFCCPSGLFLPVEHRKCNRVGYTPHPPTPPLKYLLEIFRQAYFTQETVIKSHGGIFLRTFLLKVRFELSRQTCTFFSRQDFYSIFFSPNLSRIFFPVKIFIFKFFLNIFSVFLYIYLSVCILTGVWLPKAPPVLFA